ncbi:MAG: efflux transporter outer membrane subunit [Janthinobacterium lividum]
MLAFVLALSGCMVGPDYRRPAAPITPAYKELPGWTVATPADALPKGEWWRVYDDPTLDALEREVDSGNQTLREFEAAYRLARAVVDEDRANLFPQATSGFGVTRSGSGSRSNSTSLNSALTGGTIGTAGATSTTTAGGLGGVASGVGTSGGTTGGTTAAGTSATSIRSSSGPRTNYNLQGSLDWEIDVWGRIRRQVENGVASAQASAADVANARLSAQATLATDYFNLRAADAIIALLNRTVADYQRSLRITRNQYEAGVAARSDELTAQVQLETTQAQLINAGIARAQYEHAIAVLTGRPPALLSLPPTSLARAIPAIPAVLPATLLQRRPDIASAERLMAAQNALIGAAIGAYYPTISLSTLLTYSGSPLGSLISAGNQLWSLGASASEVLFAGGARTAQVVAARATYDQSVATYRQTVLTALQQVEDQLAALRILDQQLGVATAAVTDARRSVEITLNEYRAGTQAYTAVVTAQALALGNEQTLITLQQERLDASVALIQALGGGWSASELPSKNSLQQNQPFLP